MASPSSPTDNFIISIQPPNIDGFSIIKDPHIQYNIRTKSLMVPEDSNRFIPREFIRKCYSSVPTLIRNIPGAGDQPLPVPLLLDEEIYTENQFG